MVTLPLLSLGFCSFGFSSVAQRGATEGSEVPPGRYCPSFLIRPSTASFTVPSFST